MELKEAIQKIDRLLEEKTGRSLSSPEIIILTGTWRGLTYEQMAENSDYSLNYLMRDIGPKFWKLLSQNLQRNVGKTNLRVVLENLQYDDREEKRIDPLINFNARNATNTKIQKIKDLPKLPSEFYGRNIELKTITEWIIRDKCNFVGLWGSQGIGKTILARKLVESIKDNFDYIIWNSVASYPSFINLINHIGLVYSENSTERDLINLLIYFLKKNPVLLIVDGLELILDKGKLAGEISQQYKAYDRFSKILSDTYNNSVVIFTGWEKPRIWSQINRNNSANYSLKLSGLSGELAYPIFSNEHLLNIEDWKKLINFYQGNITYLKIVAKKISKLFNGNVADFLSQNLLVFGEIEESLDRRFDRLSNLEKEIMYWLGTVRQAVSLAQIQEEIPLSIYPRELIEGLDSLERRSFIEIASVESHSLFLLPPIIKQYITNKFISQISSNFSIKERQQSRLLAESKSRGILYLGKKITKLSNWLDNKFEPIWQPIEALFINPREYGFRFRSTFNFRGEKTIKRFKRVQLDREITNSTVLLLVALEEERDSSLKICLQIQPIEQKQTLPPNITMSLLNNEEEILAKVEAKTEDNFIQLPYFKGELGEKFKIKISLDTASKIEEFTI